jgi:flagellar basal-body rod modification protein FlgD
MDLGIATSASAANAPLAKKGSGSQLGQQDFLKLMLTQLTQQDPFNPVDNQAMVAQMAQFSSLAGITTTNTTLEQISEQLKQQTALLVEIKTASNAAAANGAATTTTTTTGVQP